MNASGLLKVISRRLNPLIKRKNQQYFQSRNSPVVRYGSKYGGWFLPANHGLNEDSICYLVGAGEDISFDVSLAREFNCQIRIVDPTPKAIKHFGEVRSAIGTGLHVSINHSPTEFYDLNGLDETRIRFHAVGLAGEKKVARFYAPKNSDHASYSILNIQGTENYLEIQCVTLEDLIKENQDSHIDLLKLDIEGAEYEVLNSLIESKRFPRILLVEFDELHSPLDSGAQNRVSAVVDRLKNCGYLLDFIDGCNFNFSRDIL